MTTQANNNEQPNLHGENESNERRFGARTAANAISALWTKSRENLTTKDLEWFSGLSEFVLIETANIENSLESIGCAIINDESSGAFESRDNVAALLFSLSNQIGVIKELVFICSEADFVLRNPNPKAGDTKEGAA